MSTKWINASTLVLAFLGSVRSQAQQLPVAPTPIDTGKTPALAAVESVPPLQSPAGPTPSNWVLGTREGCCGPVGGSGPIKTELYVRTGPTIEAAGGLLQNVVSTGWNIQAGGRSLFFNLPQDSAWVVDLSISNVWNHGQHPEIPIPFDEFIPASTSATGLPIPATTVRRNVSVRSINRTYCNVDVGKEWYIGGAANYEGILWRAGGDLIGRVGSGSIQFNEIKHHNDMIWGVGLALHTDVEIPWGCTIWTTGFRAEWGQTWMDLLGPLNDSTLHDINLLWTFGLRF